MRQRPGRALSLVAALCSLSALAAPSAPTAAVDAHLERELRALGYVR